MAFLPVLSHAIDKTTARAGRSTRLPTRIRMVDMQPAGHGFRGHGAATDAIDGPHQCVPCARARQWRARLAPPLPSGVRLDGLLDLLLDGLQVEARALLHRRE